MKNAFFLIITLIAFAFVACDDVDQGGNELDPNMQSVAALMHMGGADINLSDVLTCKIDTVCFLAGQHHDAGNIYIANDGEYLYVQFATSNGWSFTMTHLFVGEFGEIPLSKKGAPKIGNFPYSEAHPDGTTMYTYKIPLSGLDECVTIAAHAEVHNWEMSETAWGCGEQFNKAWGMYREYCIEDCPTVETGVATVAFEDLYPNKGDADYNDLVIQLDAVEHYTSGNELFKIEMTFKSKARGAGYNHAFKVNVPIVGDYEGTYMLYDADGVLQDSYVLAGNGAADLNIFPDTRTVLPNPPGSNITNAVAGTCLVESWTAVVSINLLSPGDNVGGLALPVPYDPYLFVKNTNKTIHVQEIVNSGDYYWEEGGVIYPFGIIVPSDWSWPLEAKFIKGVYPLFGYEENGGVYTPIDATWFVAPQGTNHFAAQVWTPCE